MTRFLQTIDYTSRDYNSIRADMINAIQKYIDEWTDHNESDLGIVIIDLLASVEDMLHYYIDDRVNEAFLPTARQYESVQNLLKLIDYKMANPLPSSVLLKFTLDEPIANNIIIPTDHRITTSSVDYTYTFNALETKMLLAGDTELEVIYGEGVLYTEDLGYSDGSTYQRFELSYQDWAENSISVWTDDGSGGIEYYTYAETLIFEDSTAKVYDIEVDNQKTYILFGNGIHGYIPPDGYSVNVQYKRTLGLAGNIGIGMLTNILDPILDVLGNGVNISVTNEEPATGGRDRESIEYAKIYGPKTLKTLHRTVTEEDYDTLATTFYDPIYGAIGKAKAKENYTYYNRIFIYPLTEDMNGFPQIVGTPLKNALAAYMETVKTMTQDIVILDPEFLSIDLDIDVFVYPNYLNSSVLSDINAALDDMFKVVNMDFGGTRGLFALSDVYAIIEGIVGVDYLNINTPSTNIVVEEYEFPVKGIFNINVTGGAV